MNKDDETENMVAAGRPPNLPVANLPETDCFSRGDYLELQDLDNPASRSSSSDNSSCMTMSSDEYFDSIALLRDLESESNQALAQKDKDCKLSVTASLRPDEVVVLPASQGTSIINFPAPMYSCRSSLHCSVLSWEMHIIFKLKKTN